MGEGGGEQSGVRKRGMRLGAETAHTQAGRNQLLKGRSWRFHRTSFGMRRAGRKGSTEEVEGVRNEPGTLRTLTTQSTYSTYYEEATSKMNTFQSLCHPWEFTAKSGTDFYQILYIWVNWQFDLLHELTGNPGSKKVVILFIVPLSNCVLH